MRKNQTQKKSATITKPDPPIDKHQIDIMRAQLTQIKENTKQLKTKTSRMKNAIAKRETAIRNVYGQTKSSQKLKIANQNTINQLEKNIETLENVKAGQEKEIESYYKSDRYWQTVELQTESIGFFEESLRLQQVFDSSNKDTNEVKKNLALAQDSLKNVPLLRQELDSLNESIHSYNEKIHSYQTGNFKSRRAAAIYDASQNRDKIQKIQRELQKELDDLKSQLQSEQQIIKQTETEEREASEELNSIIQNAVQKIQCALEGRIENQEEEEDLKQDEKEQDEKEQEEEEHPE